MSNAKESSHLQTMPLKENLNPNSEFFEFELWASAVKEQMLLHFEKPRVHLGKRGRPKSSVN
ncbi:hypothetical protein TUMEXPCC7403_24170 [Tumidithrix helvetica PCC 7403]